MRLCKAIREIIFHGMTCVNFYDSDSDSELLYLTEIHVKMQLGSNKLIIVANSAWRLPTKVQKLTAGVGSHHEEFTIYDWNM